MQISEHEIRVESGNVTLKGTFCLPDDGGPFPVLLYVSGSGPLDRDENSPSLRLNNSKRIAHSLARLRIASMRYDKRGVGESGGERRFDGGVGVGAPGQRAVLWAYMHKGGRGQRGM